MKTFFKTIISILIVLVLFFGTSYLFYPDAFNVYTLWVVIAAAVLIFFTQAPIEISDLKNPNDNQSMLLIMINSIIVTNLTCLEYCISKPNDNFNFIKGIALIMIFGGIAFRVYAIKKLNKYFSNSVTLIENHQLYDRDIYSKIRHPSYTGAIISILGNIVWLHSWRTAIISFILIYGAYAFRIKQEEKMLINHFGYKYLKYKKKTGALLPKI